LGCESGERALQVGVEVDRPGHDALVAPEDPGAAGGHQQAVGRGDGNRGSGRGILRAVIEVAIAVVVKAVVML